jgi:hypothetical protein
MAMQTPSTVASPYGTAPDDREPRDDAAIVSDGCSAGLRGAVRDPEWQTLIGRPICALRRAIPPQPWRNRPLAAAALGSSSLNSDCWSPIGAEADRVTGRAGDMSDRMKASAFTCGLGDC